MYVRLRVASARAMRLAGHPRAAQPAGLEPELDPMPGAGNLVCSRREGLG